MINTTLKESIRMPFVYAAGDNIIAAFWILVNSLRSNIFPEKIVTEMIIGWWLLRKLQFQRIVLYMHIMAGKTRQIR